MRTCSKCHDPITGAFEQHGNKTICAACMAKIRKIAEGDMKWICLDAMHEQAERARTQHERN